MATHSAAGLAYWSGFGESVRGASHLRNGLPNQDHLDFYPRRSKVLGPPLVCAVADGHGSPKSFRSAVGAAFATRRAREVIRPFLKLSGGASDLPAALEERLPRELVLAWQNDVDEDLERSPLRAEELQHLERAAGSAARRQVENTPHLVYGSTLLVTLITASGLAFLQLGDGDILVVDENGATRRPLPHDPRLIGNETTSLCTPFAWRDFRTGWLPFNDSPPALVLLSTDGYANSFQNEAAFLQVGSDLLGLLRSEGVPGVMRNLRGWLEESSRSGSGDDITLAVLYRCAAIQADGPCASALLMDPANLQEENDD